MNITIHRVGNKINGESLLLSHEELNLDEQTKELLESYFLGSFRSLETFQFYSDTYLINNPVYGSVKAIFDKPHLLLSESEEIAEHLFEAAENPRVQGGELFIVFFKGEGENAIDKIGIFKTEKRASFINIQPNEESFIIEKNSGISLEKIDKAALIFNQNEESGYIVQAVDNNKNGDVYYWFEDFLKIRQREDDYFQTQESLMIFRDYITKQLPQEFEVLKPDQAEFLNNAINYFHQRDDFKLDEFSKEVFSDDSVIESFNNFKTDYEQDMQISVSEEFRIDAGAVKKMQRKFKTVLKLDKNFELTIKGDRSKLESGTNEKGKYYTIYFDKED